MKGTYKYLLIFTVSFFFIISACEVSTKHFTNTFDDEYDYYLHNDNSNILPVVNFSLNFEVIPGKCANVPPKIGYNYISKAVSCDSYRQSRKKQYIKNSFLLI